MLALLCMHIKGDYQHVKIYRYQRDVPRNVKIAKLLMADFFFIFSLNVMRLSFMAARNLYVFGIFSFFFHETCGATFRAFYFCNLVISLRTTTTKKREKSFR